MIFRERDHGRFVELGKEQRIEVRLRVDVKSGCSWQLIHWDPALMEKENESLEPVNGSGDGRVEHVKVFHPLSAGESSIELGHRVMSQPASQGARFALHLKSQ